ncbi:MAG: hypothetical protein LAT78_08140 [Roseinatronobacter sp.]|nr:hypothetical protein [Roseinatronobacter sp.]
MRKTGIATVAVLGLACAGAALAQMPEVETYQLGAVEVRVIAQPFLTEEELMTLRLVGQNPDALALFVPEGTGFAALAVAPDEGFVRAGMPVNSAMALSGLESADAASAAALEACNGARAGGADCVLVLEVAPR